MNNVGIRQVNTEAHRHSPSTSPFAGFECVPAASILEATPDGYVTLPQSFFSVVMATESVSTIRFVQHCLYVALQTFSIEGEGEIEVGFEELIEVLHLSRKGTRDGVQRALEAGYVKLVRQGFGKYKSVYAVNWQPSNHPQSPSEITPSQKGMSSPNGMRVKSESLDQAHGDETQLQASQKGMSSQKETTTPLAIGSSHVRAGARDSNLESSINYKDKVIKTNTRTVESAEGVVTKQHPLPSPISTAGLSRPLQPFSRQVANSPTPKPGVDTVLALPTFAPTAVKSSRPAPTPCPEYLAILAQDLSQQLGDVAHVRPNRAQVANLYWDSGLSVQEFATAMYASRELTRQYATYRQGEKPALPGQPRNTMPYFFKVLRDQLGKLQREVLQPPQSDEVTNTITNRPVMSATLVATTGQFGSSKDYVPGLVTATISAGAEVARDFYNSANPPMPNAAATSPTHRYDFPVADTFAPAPAPLPAKDFVVSATPGSTAFSAPAAPATPTPIVPIAEETLNSFDYPEAAVTAAFSPVVDSPAPKPTPSSPSLKMIRDTLSYTDRVGFENLAQIEVEGGDTLVVSLYNKQKRPDEQFWLRRLKGFGIRQLRVEPLSIASPGWSSLLNAGFKLMAPNTAAITAVVGQGARG